ncbi:MAG: hypothetical protein MK081_11255, partial [Flavobacteriales bacterium]|nr:hypothetical protein [Flavobacteriales bacterium]
MKHSTDVATIATRCSVKNLASLILAIFLAIIVVSLSATHAQAQVVIDSEEYENAKDQGLIEPEVLTYDYDGEYPDVQRYIDDASARDGECYIPHDPATWTNFPGNDDGSFGPISLPFTFDLYGSSYNEVYLNNNGNLTFDNPLSTFSSSGFPITTPMVAPFWGDVDTRNGRGEVWYYVTSTAFYVNWVEVGVYSANNAANEPFRNTFQVIITEGSDPILDSGNNVAFNYEVMDWTTGDASQGSLGFGGIPATVGVNSGNGTDFIQIGRFGTDTDDYDGPDGDVDGVNWLEDQCLQFNVSSNTNFPPIAQNVPANNEITICNDEVYELNLSFIGPEGDQTVAVVVDSNFDYTLNSNNAGNPAEVSITLSGLSPGVYTYDFTATDDGTPVEETTVTITVNVESCCEPNLTITCPADAIVECGDDIDPLFQGMPTVDIDPCFDGTVDVSHIDQVIDDATCNTVIARTWIATDGNNTEMCTQTLTILDTTAPEFTFVPADASYQCEEDIPTLDAVASDNCGDVTIEVSSESFDGSCDNEYTIVRTYTATDECGNNSSATQTISVFDTQSPVFTEVPSDLDASCDDVPAVSNALAAEDNCDADVSISYLGEEIIEGDCPQSYTIIRSWIAIDDCGNESTHSQQISVSDNSAPEFDLVGSDMTLECDEEIPAPESSASDNCGEVSIELSVEVINGECDQSYSLVRTYIATDECGNSAIATQTLTIVDTTAPEFTFVPEDATYECDEEIPAINAEASDNCGTVNVSFEDEIIEGECSQDYVIVRTFTAVDECGNANTTSQSISVVDTQAPVISDFPSDFTIECFEGQTVEEILDYLDANVPFPTIEDCSPFDVFVDASLQTDGLECPVIAVCSKTVIATDECGNESSMTLTVTVEDNTAPEFSDFEEEILVDCLEDVPAPADLTAYDSCSDENVDVEVFESNTGELIESCDLATAFGPGDDWAIWLPSLANEGLLSSANFHFDENGGTFDRFADGTGHIYGVVVNDVNPGEQFMVDFWFENESDWNTWSALGRSYKDDLGCAQDGNLYEGWTYFEMVNGFSTMTGLADNAGDVLYFYHMPDSYYFGFQLGEGANNKNCDYGISGWFTYDGFIGGEAVEGHGDLNADASCEPNNEQDCVHNTEFTYFYRAEDECGNVNIDSQLIIVDDQIAPEFTNLPEDITLPCDDVNYELPMIEAVDNCVGEVVVEYLGEEIIEGDCPHNYQIVHAWAAFDVCGNRADGEWTITVVDEEAPELIGLPEAEITVECDMVDPAADVTAMDNCSEEANIEFSFNEEIIEGDCPGNYTIIRNWYAMDECGNESSFEQIVNVQDTTAPEFNDYEFYTAVPCEDIDTYTLTASDNCGEATVEIVEEILQSGGCLGVLYRVYEATDECGNTSTVEQYITITDTTAPELVNIPADETLECSEVALGEDGNYFNAGDVFGVDNCGDEVTIEYSEEIAEDGDDCEQSYLIIRTWVAIDYCENESMAQQTVTIVDTTSPEFVEFPADETVECDEELPAVVFPIAEDNCDDVVSIELTEEIVDGECENEYVLNRIFRAFDDCGNEVMGVQSINVVDTTAPEFTMVPEAINVECNEEVPATEATAIDNCGDVTITYDDQFLTQGNCPQEFSMIRTFTAVDACGNSSTATQQINIVDTTAPVFDEYPAEVEVPCDDLNAELLTASDNCGEVTITYEDTFVSGGCAGTIIRDYLAVDECGNEATAQQILSLYDNTAPEFVEFPSDMDAECDDIPAVAQELAAEDNCDEEVEIEYLGEEIIEGDCPQ